MKLLGVQSAPSLASCKHLESVLLLQTILLTPQGSPRTLYLQVLLHLHLPHQAWPEPVPLRSIALGSPHPRAKTQNSQEARAPLFLLYLRI